MGQPNTGQSGLQQQASKTTIVSPQTSPVIRQIRDQQTRQWMTANSSIVFAKVESRVYSQKERRQSVIALGELAVILGRPAQLGTTDEAFRGAVIAFADECISGSTKCEVRKGEVVESLHYTPIFTTLLQGIVAIGPEATPQLDMSFGHIRPRNEDVFRPGLFYSLSGVSFTASSGKSKSETGRERHEQILATGRKSCDALETTTVISVLRAIGKESGNESNATTFLALGSIWDTQFQAPTFQGQDMEPFQIDERADSSLVTMTYGASSGSY